MTDREKAIVSAFTGIAMLAGGKFSIFHEYIEEKLGRPVWTHELADKDVWAKIKEASMEDFIALCKEENSLQKPLTLEEAMDGKEPGVCVEHKVPCCIYYAFVSDSEFEGMCNIESIGRSTPCIARIADYGKEWRCWAAKPTQEEREAAKWE